MRWIQILNEHPKPKRLPQRCPFPNSQVASTPISEYIDTDPPLMRMCNRRNIERNSVWFVLLRFWNMFEAFPNLVTFPISELKDRRGNHGRWNKTSYKILFLPFWESYRPYTSWVASILSPTTTIPKVDAKPRTKGRDNLSRWMEQIWAIKPKNIWSHTTS